MLSKVQQSIESFNAVQIDAYSKIAELLNALKAETAAQLDLVQQETTVSLLNYKISLAQIIDKYEREKTEALVRSLERIQAIDSNHQAIAELLSTKHKASNCNNGSAHATLLCAS